MDNMGMADRFWQALIAGVFAVSVSGCFSGPRVATYLTAPPAQRYPVAYRHAADDMVERAGIRPIQVPVGPPKATLEVLILEPGHYAASVTTQPSGSNLFERVSRLVEYRPRSTTRPVASRGTIFLLHGYSAVKETLMSWGVLLADHGYRCVLVDLRGHGRSGGEVFSLGKYETADMIQVLDYLSQRGLCDNEVGVMGWSFGADLGLFWGARDKRVKTVFAIAPYDRPEQALAGMAGMLQVTIPQKSLKEGMEIAAKRLDVNWEDWTGSAAARAYGRSFIMVRGSADTISRQADVDALMYAAPDRSLAITIDGVNHLNVAYRLLFMRELVYGWFDGRLRVRSDDPQGRVEQ